MTDYGLRQGTPSTACGDMNRRVRSGEGRQEHMLSQQANGFEGGRHTVSPGAQPRLEAGAQRTLEGIGPGPWVGRDLHRL